MAWGISRKGVLFETGPSDKLFVEEGENVKLWCFVGVRGGEIYLLDNVCDLNSFCRGLRVVP